MTAPRLVTDRLVLRPWRPDGDADVAAAYDLYRREEVVRFLGATPQVDASPEVTRDRLVRYVQRSVEEPDGLGVLAIEADGRAIGTALLTRLPDGDGVQTDDVEVGWHLHPDHWGHGYATEAARALLEHGFATLGLAEIHAVAYADNHPSLAVMQRIGMTRQGSTDRWYGVTMDWWRAARP
jgi:RimJ/RimL family protein N-acetyltransferase